MLMEVNSGFVVRDWRRVGWGGHRIGSLEANTGTKLRVQDVYGGNLKERGRCGIGLGKKWKKGNWSRLHKAVAHVAAALGSVLSTRVPCQVERSGLSALTSFRTRM